MRNDLAHPVHLADEGWRDEYRQHRRHHDWLRDFFLIGWLTFWIVAGLFTLLLAGGAQ